MSLIRRSSSIKRAVSRHTRNLLRQYAQEGRLSRSVPQRNVLSVAVEMTEDERGLYDDIRDLVCECYQGQANVNRDRPQRPLSGRPPAPCLGGRGMPANVSPEGASAFRASSAIRGRTARPRRPRVPCDTVYSIGGRPRPCIPGCHRSSRPGEVPLRRGWKGRRPHPYHRSCTYRRLRRSR